MSSSESEDSRSEEEEEEEEEEEVSDYSTGPSKKRGGKRARGGGDDRKSSKKQKVSLFEDEASEGEGEEEEEEREVYRDGGAYEELDEEEKRIKERYDARLKQRDNFLEQDVEQAAAALESRYKAQNRTYERDDEGAVIARNAYLPELTDPRLFCVKCKPGEERMLCLQLMNKYRNLAEAGKPPKIFSALAPGTKGFVWIESFTQNNVQEALYGIRGVFRSKITLVPLGEMPAVLRVQSQKQVLKVGDFVRLRRFPYKNDLGRIVSVLESESKFVVKYLPRLDNAMFGMTPEERKEHKKKKIIVGQRFFNPTELENAGAYVQRQRPDWYDEVLYFYDNDYFENGYVLRTFQERNLTTKNVKPTLEELQKFRHGKALDGEDDDDVEGALEDGNVLDELGNAGLPVDARKAAGGPVFKRGDIVLVKEGDLKHMEGEVTAINMNGTVEVNPLHSDVRGTMVVFSPSELQKKFKEGDHVKVLNGSYAGETGSVVKVIEDSDKWKAIVFTDSSAKEIMAFIDDLQISAEVAQAKDSLKGFNLFDLVSLGVQVGVIVKVGSESMDVLQQTGSVRTITPQEIRAKLNQKSRSTNAMDFNRNPISVGTIVKVVSGEAEGLSGIEGTIKHIHRSFLFIQSRMRTQHGGMIVVRARSVVQAGVKLRNAGGFGVAARGAASAQLNNTGGRGRGRGRAGDQDSIIGKTVKIRHGRHKGYIGVVTSAIESRIKVQLHSKKKVVELDRGHTFIIGDKNGQVGSAFGGRGAGRGAGMMAGFGAGFAPETPLVAPNGPDANADQQDAWNPNVGSSTPKPGTPGADDDWANQASSSSSKVPPTPSFSSGYAHGVAATPAATVPQTPATPAVPKTPAVGGYDDGGREEGGMRKGTRVRIVAGLSAGQYATINDIEKDEAIVIMEGSTKVKILPLASIVQA